MEATVRPHAVQVNDPTTTTIDNDNTTETATADTALKQQEQDNTNGGAASVQVAVRVRPILASEGDGSSCLEVLPSSLNNNSNNNSSHNSLRIGGPSGPRFSFDCVFPVQTSQAQVYDSMVQPLLASTLEGYNATILAYGQTGSGKTHTVMGNQNSSAHDDENDEAGIIPRALHHLFEKLEGTNSSNNSTGNNNNTTSSIVQVQFLEVYGEEIRDLLSTKQLMTNSHHHHSSHHSNSNSSANNNNKLTIREDAMGEPTVVGATQPEVQTAAQALRILQQGLLRRVTGATAMNTSSSRSHAMFSLLITQTISISSGNSDDATDNPPPVQQRRSKFHFVDLAGSERQKRTQASGQRLKEGIDINKGLLVLGNVISALSSPENKNSHHRRFVPYRDSKLTRLLQGSLGGNHKTLMLACVSPAAINLEESLNCLRYANRAKNIQNVAIVNVDPATRRLQQLTGLVQKLAGELLHVAYSNDNNDDPDNDGKVDTVTAAVTTSISKVDLQALVGGGGDDVASMALNINMPSTPCSTPNTPAAGTPCGGVMSPLSSFGGSPLRHQHVNNDDDYESRQLLESVQQELEATKRQLRQVQMHHETAEEQLYVTKAAKQLVDLQLSVATSSSSSPGGSKGSGAAPRTLDQAMVEQATEYERRIGELQSQLAQASAFMEQPIDPHALEKAQEGLERDRQRLLLALQQEKQQGDSKEGGELDNLIAHGGEPATSISTAAVDKEEETEEQALQHLTNKYLDRSESSDHDADDVTGDPTDDHQDASQPSSINGGILQADLIELSRSIAVKEELIDQLKLSQEKYASMQDFYETKLEQMKTALGEKESEREDLLRQLASAKTGDPKSTLLGEKLKEKEAHIATLRRRQKELMNLTTVSSRNDSEITRLLSDVTEMKRKKVDLQKQLGSERKSHATELKKLRKDALQKDRELNKQLKISNQREAEANRFNQIAKTRLEELGQMRIKYKDAEKKIRLLSVKRGVMAKAGLDPVLVGRRVPKSLTTTAAGNGRHSASSTSRSTRKAAATTPVTVDADALRDYFDKKVADVARKESLVDKLAKEWEEHFELASQKASIDVDDEDSKELEQALEVQVQFKENRIRQLAQRLGRQEVVNQGESSNNKEAGNNDEFLFDREFNRIRAGVPAQKATGTASRVLFGMVVRERRRIANLARTASSLDERLQDAEKKALESEAALRSYMDEQRHEVAAMTQSQQEQILSLMDMVKQESSDSEASRVDRGLWQRDVPVAQTLEVLANERIEVLETQLAALKTESEAAASYRKQIQGLKSDAARSAMEVEDLHEELSGLRSALRQIREVAGAQNDEGVDAEQEVLEIVKSVLHPLQPKPTAGRPTRQNGRSGRRPSDRSFISPRVKKHVTLIHTSDSAEEFGGNESPDWTAEIMADLALIAEGKVPPSLVGSPGVPAPNEESMGPEPNTISVFDRLADPDTFTGVQKQVVTHARSDSRGKDKKQRQEMSKQIADQLNRIVIPDGKPHAGTVADNNSKSSVTSPSKHEAADDSDSKDYQSVFERLISPSHYTGTQKEKFQKSKDKRFRAAEDVADRMLNDLLNSDSENTAAADNSESAVRGGLTNEYTQQDVFERLQRTTTQSYAVKHNGTMLPDYSDFSIAVTNEPNNASFDPSPGSQGPGNSGSIDEADSESAAQNDYTRQNVFERLQRTTTEAYKAKREN